MIIFAALPSLVLSTALPIAEESCCSNFFAALSSKVLVETPRKFAARLMPVDEDGDASMCSRTAIKSILTSQQITCYKLVALASIVLVDTANEAVRAEAD